MRTDCGKSDTNFYYFWFEGTNLFSTNAVAVQVLPAGGHEITLLLDDTFPWGTNSASVRVEVVTPCAGVGLVQAMVEGSTLPPNGRQPLLATLEAACASFERGQFTAGANELQAFQNKVRAQVAPDDAALAEALVAPPSRSWMRWSAVIRALAGE